MEGGEAAPASKGVLRRFKQTEVVGDLGVAESLPRSLLGKVRKVYGDKISLHVSQCIPSHLYCFGVECMKHEGTQCDTHKDVLRRWI